MDPFSSLASAAVGMAAKPLLKHAAIKVGDKLIESFPEFEEELRNLPHAGTCVADIKQLSADGNTVNVRFDNHSSIDKRVLVAVARGENSGLEKYEELVWTPGQNHKQHVHVDDSITSVWVTAPGIGAYYVTRVGSYWTGKQPGLMFADDESES